MCFQEVQKFCEMKFLIDARIASFLCNSEWLHLVFKHLRYHRINHVVTVNQICIVMSCLEIDMGKSGGTVFSLSFQKDWQCQYLNSSLRHKFYGHGQND